jgi:hypothetical protein
MGSLASTFPFTRCNHMNKIRNLLALGLLAASASLAGGLLPYAERVLKYPSDSTLDPYLQNHWAGWRSRFVLSSGIIKATKPDYTAAYVSEGQSYGMLLALWFNDKKTFDQIYQATQSNFWGGTNSPWYAWIIGPSPNNRDNNFAGDADQDILGALIFASALVDANLWADGSPSYKVQAIAILKSIEANMVDGSNLIRSWNNSSGIYNPSYHMPGWCQVFKEFGAANGVTTTNWDDVHTAEYGLFNAQPSASSGMVRNWSTSSGGSASANGQTETPSLADMSFDAIRVPYRISLDNLWYHTPAAGKWCNDVWNAGVVRSVSPGMYQLNNPPTLWGWGTASLQYSDAAYEKPMTEAMWGACGSTVLDSSNASLLAGNAISSYIIAKLKGPTNYFTTSDSTPANNYYAQSLEILGSLVISGRAWNVWDDLKHTWTPPDTTSKVIKALTATPTSVAMGANTTLTASFNHAVNWTLTFTGGTSKATYVVGPTLSSSISTQWNTTDYSRLTKFAAGETVTAVVSGPWAAGTAGTSATIAIAAANGIQAPQSHLSAFAWTAEGLRVPAGLVEEGQSVQVRVLDLSGRQQGAMRSATAHASGNATVLDVAPQHMAQAGFVEIRTANGEVERLLLPPIR